MIKTIFLHWRFSFVCHGTENIQIFVKFHPMAAFASVRGIISRHSLRHLRGVGNNLVPRVLSLLRESRERTLGTRLSWFPAVVLWRSLWGVNAITVLSDRAVFIWVWKSNWFCVGVWLSRYVIGLKDSRHFFFQSEVKPKPIVSLLAALCVSYM